MVDGLGEALRDRLQVAPGEAAVGREALGQDEQRAAALGERVVVRREPAADVRERVLLGADRHPVGEPCHLAHDVGDVALALARLALADEPGVLGEAAGVEVERHAVAVADGAHGTQVLERDRLPAPGVVRDRDHHDRHVLGAPLRDEAVERLHVHVALERMLRRGVVALGDDEVDRLGARELDVRPGGVEMRVVGHDLARAADRREQDLLGGAALVGRDHVLEREERAHRLEEDEPGRRAGVALVAALDRGPLVAGHRARAGVGQEVDEDVGRVEPEDVVPGVANRAGAVRGRRQLQRLDRVDAERLDDRLEHVPGPTPFRARRQASACAALSPGFARGEPRRPAEAPTPTTTGLCPVARSVVETGFPGGICVAGSGRAEPRHLRGSP